MDRSRLAREEEQSSSRTEAKPQDKLQGHRPVGRGLFTGGQILGRGGRPPATRIVVCISIPGPDTRNSSRWFTTALNITLIISAHTLKNCLKVDQKATVQSEHVSALAAEMIRKERRRLVNLHIMSAPDLPA